MANYEALVEELMKLSPTELLKVLDSLIERIAAAHDLELAREIVERYRSSFEELALM